MTAIELEQAHAGKAISFGRNKVCLKILSSVIHFNEPLNRW